MRFFVSMIGIAIMLFIGGCQAVEPAATTIDQVEGVHLNLLETEIALTFFSLTSGESTLIQNGMNGTVLINTGDVISKQELEDRLAMYHVERIDTILITNGNPEYIGNLPSIIQKYNVNKIIVPNVIRDKLVSAYHLDPQTVEGWDVGKQNDILPGILTEVFYVEEKDEDSQGAMVVSFVYENYRTLYMGIANEDVERKLTEKYPLKSAILKVADFGSEKGTSQVFLEEVDPQVAILFKKKSRMVSELVIERLQETWIDIYQTYRHGNVSIKCNGDDYEILTVRSDEEDLSGVTPK
ncbi:ComEC/Rec2 family competence protein [Anaerobacillus sp. MEB173]|uniref:ComEC/Rec2 family competence protein n=1 Tax=Anaerobacillus sp. MEB173 TaxID=3383345 RepID=UPI003F92CC8B